MGAKKRRSILFALVLLLLLGGGAWLAQRTTPTGTDDSHGGAAPRTGAGGDSKSPDLAAEGGRAKPTNPDEANAVMKEGASRRAPSEGELESAELWIVEAGSNGKPVELPKAHGVGPQGNYFSATGTTGGNLYPAPVGSPVTLWVWAPGYAAKKLVGIENSGVRKVELEKGVPARLRFWSVGAEIDPLEVKRRYTTSGTRLEVQLIADADLSSGDPASALGRTLGGNEAAWQFTTAIEFPASAVRLRDAVEPGSWWLVVPRPTLPPQLVRSTTAPSRGLEFHVELGLPPRMIRVRCVEAETKTPLPGAIAVPMIEFGDDTAFFAGQERVADARGELDLPRDAQMGEGMREPTWWFYARDRVRYVPSWALRKAPEEVTLDVEMQRTATIVGKAYRKDGKPAEGARVIARSKGRDVTDTVNAEGKFVLDGIALEGTPQAMSEVLLVRDITKLDTEFATVPIRAGEITEVTLGSPLGAGSTGAIRGTLTASGQPVVGARVAVAPMGTKPGADDRPLVTTTDAEGRFMFESVPVGDQALHVLLGDPRISYDAVIDSGAHALGTGEEWVVALDLPGGAFRVTVLDAAGNPAPGAWVSARPVEAKADTVRFPGFMYVAGMSSAADAQGVAILRGLPVGSPHFVYASPPGRGAVYGEVSNVVPGTLDAPADVTVRLPK